MFMFDIFVTYLYVERHISSSHLLHLLCDALTQELRQLREPLPGNVVSAGCKVIKGNRLARFRLEVSKVWFSSIPLALQMSNCSTPDINSAYSCWAGNGLHS